jgi:hypothetical protein
MGQKVLKRMLAVEPPPDFFINAIRVQMNFTACPSHLTRHDFVLYFRVYCNTDFLTASLLFMVFIFSPATLMPLS